MTAPERAEVRVPLPVADDLSDAALTALAKSNPEYQALLIRLWATGQHTVTLHNPATNEQGQVTLPISRRRVPDSFSSLFAPPRLCPCCRRPL